MARQRTSVAGVINYIVRIRKMLPTECWYYSHSEYAYNDPDGVAEAPDWYEYKYQASEGTPLYYIQEIWCIGERQRVSSETKIF